MTVIQKLNLMLEALPEAVRTAKASAWLEELETQDLNGSHRHRYWIAGHKPNREQVRKNIEGLRAFRREHKLTLGDISIRELIEEGRH